MTLISVTTDARELSSNLRDRLVKFLQVQTGETWQVGELHRYAVGFSWITYGFSARTEAADSPLELILRLGPSYGLFAPYSALPQFAALKTLEGSEVAAPRAYWWSDDASILGAPFFISERVAGIAPVPWGGSDGSGFEEGYRRQIGSQFVSSLAALHRHEWQGQGFDDSVTTENAATMQLDFWEQAGERWALRPYPMLRRAQSWLRNNLPVAPRVSLVHGDYRLGNFLEQDGKITAILDWELVHPGDPHEDLGWAFLPQYAMGSGLICRLVSREEFIAQYERESGISVNEASLHFYQVFSLVKLALTHIAAVRRFEDGGFNDMRMPAMGTQIAPVLRQIEKMLP